MGTSSPHIFTPNKRIPDKAGTIMVYCTAHQPSHTKVPARALRSLDSHWHILLVLWKEHGVTVKTSSDRSLHVSPRTFYRGVHTMDTDMSTLNGKLCRLFTKSLALCRYGEYEISCAWAQSPPVRAAKTAARVHKAHDTNHCPYPVPHAYLCTLVV